MNDQPKRDPVPLRRALKMLCAVTFYLGAVFVITLAWHSATEPVPPPYGSKDAAEYVRGPELLVFDRVTLEDFPRRLTALHTVPTVAILGGSAGCLLIAGLLIRRYHSGRSTPTA
jgi:hypothetical protein